jgi:hypothetical protein
VSTADILVSQYGPLLTIAQLAGILNRSTDGLRISLRSQNPFSRAVNAARIRLGRRVYFSTTKIAAIIEVA